MGEQGFSIHHATGWYLNFGLPGLLFGAVLWGWIWGRCFNAYLCAEATRDRGGRWRYAFAVMAPWGFVAYIPPLIRAGLEGYKGLVIEGLLVPMLVVSIASFGSGLLARLFAPLSMAAAPAPTE